jgi:uncharacterized damage-inducible protein DinB
MTDIELHRQRLAESLDRAARRIASIPDAEFRTPAPHLGISSVGAHFRHVADAVECFVDGVILGMVDYDQRRRDPRHEYDRQLARARFEALAQKVRDLDLSALAPGIDVVLDAPEAASDVAPDVATRSTPAREMSFLASHAIHHEALIAIVLRVQGVAVEPECGMAPATLRHAAGGATCAP